MKCGLDGSEKYRTIQSSLYNIEVMIVFVIEISILELCGSR